MFGPSNNLDCNQYVMNRGGNSKKYCAWCNSNINKHRQIETKDLNQQGIDVAGTHWHWRASYPYVAAIHHQNVGMDPVQFASKT